MYSAYKLNNQGENSSVELNIQKMKIMTYDPITSWQIDGKKSENSGRFYFLGVQNHCRQ